MLFRSLSRNTRLPAPAFEDGFRAGTPYGTNEENLRASQVPGESRAGPGSTTRVQMERPSIENTHPAHEPLYDFLDEGLRTSALFSGFLGRELESVATEELTPGDENAEQKTPNLSRNTSSSFSPSDSPKRESHRFVSNKSSTSNYNTESSRSSPKRDLSTKSSTESAYSYHVHHDFSNSVGYKRSPTAEISGKGRAGVPPRSNAPRPAPLRMSSSFHMPSYDSINEKANPFATPSDSVLTSPRRSPFPITAVVGPRYFFSRRVKKEDVDKPWIDEKDPKEKWIAIIPVIGMLIGLAIAGFFVWDGLRSVVNHKYCSVYSTDFSGGLDNHIWQKEVEIGGFGNGQFEQTTATDENVFVKDGMLHIKPTIQDPKLVEHDNVIDLRKDGACTSEIWSDCISSTNTTNGTIINPVKSGRINTKKGASIKYGRVEVTAKLPSGDWLWPAIWMLPVNATYGKWPLSGEIDIMESRGNNYTYNQGGNNIMSSALHWGPDAANDAWWRNNVKRQSSHTTYAQKFHTYGVEWSERYLFTYVDNRLLQVLYVNFDPKQSLWQRGNFPLANKNGTQFVDPWSKTGRPSTPFDQDFYLIIDVAVGGTNGWFQDGQNGKPWVDGSPTAKKDFWAARDKWLKTWETGGEMQVKSVKIWQQAGYNGCLA